MNLQGEIIFLHAHVNISTLSTDILWPHQECPAETIRGIGRDLTVGSIHYTKNIGPTSTYLTAAK